MHKLRYSLHLMSSIYFYYYLIVDSCNDGCPHSHANGEAAMEILVEKQGLDHSGEEENNSIDIATPIGITLILCKINHQPLRDFVAGEYEWV